MGAFAVVVGAIVVEVVVGGSVVVRIVVVRIVARGASTTCTSTMAMSFLLNSSNQS